MVGEGITLLVTVADTDDVASIVLDFVGVIELYVPRIVLEPMIVDT